MRPGARGGGGGGKGCIGVCNRVTYYCSMHERERARERGKRVLSVPACEKVRKKHSEEERVRVRERIKEKERS